MQILLYSVNPLLCLLSRQIIVGWKKRVFSAVSLPRRRSRAKSGPISCSLWPICLVVICRFIVCLLSCCWRRNRCCRFGSWPVLWITFVTWYKKCQCCGISRCIFLLNCKGKKGNRTLANIHPGTVLNAYSNKKNVYWKKVSICIIITGHLLLASFCGSLSKIRIVVHKAIEPWNKK